MTDQPKLLFKRVCENAKPPTRQSDGAAGYDLYAVETIAIPAQSRALIKTGLVVKIPEGHYGRIASRSSVAFKFSCDVCAGVIDQDYRGEVGILLYNTSTIHAYVVKQGERVAQLILEKCSILPTEEVSELDPTNRNEGGFGSTGTN